MHRVAIGMGSNIGKPREHLDAACGALQSHPEVQNFICSSYFETKPVGRLDQPDFLNAAATFSTSLSPSSLLQFLLLTEQSRGRNRLSEQRWGPRTLDLDILLFGDQVIETPVLCVPHIHMQTRRFVLEPLAQIAADWVVPPSGLKVRELLEALNGKN